MIDIKNYVLDEVYNITNIPKNDIIAITISFDMVDIYYNSIINMKAHYDLVDFRGCEYIEISNGLQDFCGNTYIYKEDMFGEASLYSIYQDGHYYKYFLEFDDFYLIGNDSDNEYYKNFAEYPRNKDVYFEKYYTNKNLDFINEIL